MSGDPHEDLGEEVRGGDGRSRCKGLEMGTSLEGVSIV